MDFATLHHTYRAERAKTFIIMWFVYVAYYLLRKNYAVAMPVVLQEYHWNEMDVGIILTAYSAAYAVGQFVNGFLGDRLGAKVLIGFGLGVSILANLLFPMYASVPFLMLVWGINGYAQATGWPGCVKVMSGWFSAYERGTVMGFWSTSYQMGGVLANFLAAFMLTWLNWKYCFFGPAITVVGLLAVYLVFQKEKPEDSGLMDVESYYRLKNQKDAVTEIPQSSNAAPSANLPVVSTRAIILDVLTNKTVLAYGASYFFLKFIRYSLLFWLPLYMVRHFQYEPAKAGITSTMFEVGGIAGAIFAGWISDKCFQARRAPISTFMLLGLAGVSLLYANYAACGIYANIFLMALLGFMLYGPDSVMSGTGVMDAASKERAATAAGFVNGMGSIGQAVQGVLIGYVVTRFGWDKVFYIFLLFSVLAAICAASQWNARPLTIPKPQHK